MWTKLFAVALLVAIVIVAIAGMRDTPVRRVVAPEVPSEVEAALDGPLTNFALDKVPLEEALARVKQAAGVDIRLDRKALEVAGVDPRAPVTVAPLRKGTLARVLDLALESASTQTARLGYVARSEHLLVSTSEVLAGVQEVRVYDVRDLMLAQANLPHFHDTPNLCFGGPPPGGQGLIPAQSSPPPWIDELMMLITETVAPDTWRDAGGSLGAIRELRGRLIINQAWGNHRAIRALLDSLREPTPPVPPRVAKHAWNERLQRWVTEADPADPELVLVKDLPAAARVEGSTLRAALDSLGKAAGVEILLDEQALADAGYDLKRPIDVRRPVGGQTLARALGGVLAAAGDPPLGYTLRDSGLVVTTAEQADAVRLVRVYDIRDLLPKHATDLDRASAVELVVDAIVQTVAPDSWRDHGGSVGSVRESAGFLFVTQNLRNHEAVAPILAGLRAARPTTGPATAPAAGQ